MHAVTTSVRSAVLALLGCASLSFGSSAHAVAQPQDIHLSYDVTTTIDQPITDVITYNTYVQNSGSWWPASVPAGGGTIVDPFPKSSANEPLSGLILGIVTNLPGDADGQQHLVLGEDSTAAQASVGIAWGTLFPNYTEEQIIADVAEVAGVQRTDANATQWDAAANELNTFTQTDAKSNWFSLGAVVPGSTTLSNFSVIAFSNGQQIGTGVANLKTDAPVVPEPSTLSLILAGCMGVAFATRRHAGKH